MSSEGTIYYGIYDISTDKYLCKNRWVSDLEVNENTDINNFIMWSKLPMSSEIKARSRYSIKILMEGVKDKDTFYSFEFKIDSNERIYWVNHMNAIPLAHIPFQ